ncbi:uncharacterized protein LOC135391325 isoform X2 [Ornithodoros turicata]|uniref:uncharacterized protein LOC135391325 isoform X2 n=1 Tax=Ornithodoros turicata TaxID=34597 RepID=UPI00313A03CF
MSYPISNTSDFTIQQMEVLTKARFDSGIHIILTNPFVSEKVSQNSTEVTVCQLARGIQNGTNLTHAFCFPQQSSTEAKFRFRADDRDSGNETGKYMEYHMSPGGTHFYVRNVGKGKSVGTMSTALNMKMPVVLQMEVPDDGCIKVSCDGGTMQETNEANFGTDFVLQRIDQAYDAVAVMEIHITYKSDSNKIFNTSADFSMPEFPLSPGAYLVWEGYASGAFTVKYNGTQIYTATKHASGLRLVMEMFITTILIGLDGEQTTCVANPKTTGAATNTKHPLVLSSGFHLTNFTMQTGSR